MIKRLASFQLGDEMKKAYRSAALTFKGNPFFQPVEECVYYEEDALIIVEDGKFTSVGYAPDLLQDLDPEVEVRHFKDALILPGFIDCHVHYPQTEIIGAYGKQLIDWLNKYTFVAEQNFSDKAHAAEAAGVFIREILSTGTTTASVFCTVDPTSVDAFFEESVKFGLRNIAGKVLMDRHAPDGLLDTAQTGYDQTKALIEKWHEKDRCLYSVTPRFAPTSTPEQMDMAGKVWQEHPGTYLQTHISENLKEMKWVKELYPSSEDYLDVYDSFGQVGPRSIYGHGVHLTDREWQRLHESGAALAHCPTSNLFLGSGLFDVRKAMSESQEVRVGLATDCGGGTSFSQLTSMNEAYKIAQLNGISLNAFQAFYLATRGAAEALYLEDKIGSLQVGLEADMVVLDLKASPTLEYRLSFADEIHDILFVLMTIAHSNTVKATISNGNIVCERNSDTGIYDYIMQ